MYVWIWFTLWIKSVCNGIHMLIYNNVNNVMNVLIFLRFDSVEYLLIPLHVFFFLCFVWSPPVQKVHSKKCIIYKFMFLLPSYLSASGFSLLTLRELHKKPSPLFSWMYWLNWKKSYKRSFILFMYYFYYIVLV